MITKHGFTKIVNCMTFRLRVVVLVCDIGDTCLVKVIIFITIFYSITALLLTGQINWIMMSKGFDDS